MENDLNTSGDLGAVGVTGGHVSAGYVNKLAMLGEGGVSFIDVEEKEGLPEDYTTRVECDQSPGASPVDLPVYHHPEPPPQYTRHPSVGETQAYCKDNPEDSFKTCL